MELIILSAHSGEGACKNSIPSCAAPCSSCEPDMRNFHIIKIVVPCKLRLLRRGKQDTFDRTNLNGPRQQSLKGWRKNMNSSEVFAHCLKIKFPWSVVKQFVDFAKVPNEIHIEVHADRRNLYPCPECGKKRQVRDTVRLIWRHADFFGFPCFVTANTPKIDCPDHGIVQPIISWLHAKDQLSVAQLAKAREPSSSRKMLNRLIHFGQMGMGGESCTREVCYNHFGG